MDGIVMSKFGTFNENNPVWRAISRLVDMVLMGFFFLLTCLPVVTIGAALSGFYYAAMDSMRKEDGYIFSRYFKAFAKNFKKSTIIWIIMLAAGAICNAYLYGSMILEDSPLVIVMRVIGAVLSIAWLMIFFFVFPLQARFENTIKNTFKNAILLSVAHFPFTIIMFLLVVVLVVFCLFIFPYSAFLEMVGAGIIGYMVVRYYETNFKKWGYIDEDDGKIKDDDYEFEVEVDYDELYHRNEEKPDEDLENDSRQTSEDDSIEELSEEDSQDE